MVSFMIRHMCDANNRHWRWWPHLWEQRADCVQHPSWAALLFCWPQDRWGKVDFWVVVIFNKWSFCILVSWTHRSAQSLSTALPSVFYSPCVMPSSSDQKVVPLRGELLGLISLLKNVRGSPFRDTAHKGIAAQINEGLFNSSYRCRSFTSIRRESRCFLEPRAKVSLSSS